MPTKKKSDTSPYDKILKETLAPTLPVLLKKVLKMEADKMEYLPQTKQQKTREREPDFAAKIWNKNYPKSAVFHVELETTPTALRRYRKRMLDYYAIFYSQTGKEVLQNLIFCGPGKPPCPNKIKHGKLQFEFPVYYLSEVPYSEFLNAADAGEEVIWSIMADFQGKKAEEAVEEILKCLARLFHGDKLKLQQAITQLEVLSQMRKLQPIIIQKVEKMLTGYDLTKDIRYQQGIEKTQRDVIERLLREFPKLPDRRIARIAGSKQELVKQIREELMKQMSAA